MSDRASTELKPCPFCGGAAYIVQIGNAHTPSRGFDVGCAQCRIKISDRAIRKSLDWLLPQTIANWNRRSDEKEPSHE